ncbi:MAG: FAD-binding protein [Oscillospiraceae bacterium]|nr:FAD-binding protein [Oscillospiraceae bacterium]
MNIREIIEVNTCIVGSGAAGYNAADRLWQYGQHSILLISENIEGGTSRNTGSDKQTYYKLTLSSDTPDSVYEMAKTLYDGKCVDGDLALCEAALSVPSFLRLVELGVPFPVNRYGEYVGYKTDHDPRNRATSVGPYTSREMTRVLEQQCREYGIPVRDHLQVIRILSDGEKVYGLLCLDRAAEDEFVLIKCPNVIYATGGPAAIYRNCVYPASQFGATGLALEAGALGKNLTEWQFGLASVRPRWNVSGTYMQVLPRVVSTDQNGSDEREFLLDFFSNPEEMLSMLFLKGYQWPFDVRKVDGGSSVIDILVYLELCKDRRVFLDFRRDAADGRFSFEKLSEEAREYLTRANALMPLPIDRLKVMNQPAIDFYLDNGVDLTKEMLEISLCAQHNNGGIDIDYHWQSCVEGLFVVGEAAGSHGVYRPGGSALNAGQVGSTRAALYIAKRREKVQADDAVFSALAEKTAAEMSGIAEAVYGSESNIMELKDRVSGLMSTVAGAIRNSDKIREALQEVELLSDRFNEQVRIDKPSQLQWVYRLRDMLISIRCYMTAMLDYAASGGKSRGSALYTDLNGKKPYDQLPDEFIFQVDDGKLDEMIQTVGYDGKECSIQWRSRRPIPENNDFFEVVWKSYRESGNID